MDVKKAVPGTTHSQAGAKNELATENKEMHEKRNRPKTGDTYAKTKETNTELYNEVPFPPESVRPGTRNLTEILEGARIAAERAKRAQVPPKPPVTEEDFKSFWDAISHA